MLTATAAQAQYGLPYPAGIGVGNGTLQGQRDYNDWQQTRRDHGLDYDRSVDRPSPYQPYPTVAPHYDPYHPRTNNGTPYGDD